LQGSAIKGSNRSVGDSAGFKTFKNPVLTISDPHFAPFSDMSMGHRIFSHGQISAPLQIAKAGVTRDLWDTNSAAMKRPNKRLV